MSTGLSEEQKLKYIHHWENQAGRVLRLSITILGLIISAVSVFITLIVTSEKFILPKNFLLNSFQTLVAKMTTLPILGEPTALVLVFILMVTILITTTVALVTIFVMAPIQSIEVMDVGNLSNVGNGTDLDDFFDKKQEEWHQTVALFKYGVYALVISIIASIPLFVVRNVTIASLTVLAVIAIVLIIALEYSEALKYHLWTSSKVDLLYGIGGVVLVIFLPNYPYYQNALNLIMFGSLCFPAMGGMIRGYSKSRDQVIRYLFRDILFGMGFFIGAFPTLLVVSDLLGGNYGVALFILMTSVGIVSTASSIGTLSGLGAHVLVKKVRKLRFFALKGKMRWLFD